MAASSSSSSSWTYDVYLSFRGQDTRHGFTTHLYNALKQRGIHVYVDDAEVEKGDDISAESFLQAIEASQIVLVIFSPNYAYSRNCLDELVKIMECQRRLAQVVVPIFYKVDPFDVRYLQGTYGEAMKRHELRLESGNDKALRWSEALREIASVSGFHLTTHRKEKEVEISKLLMEDMGLAGFFSLKILKMNGLNLLFDMSLGKMEDAHSYWSESELLKKIVEEVSRVLSLAEEHSMRIEPQVHEAKVDEWFNFDVFLSFRGEDTRHGFTSHLCRALRQSGIHTFMDDSGLEWGEQVSASLLQAIERSQTALVIFSPDYAASTWCLDELVKIMECRTSLAQVAIPIFYDVDPSEVRHQRGTYGEAMKRHEQTLGSENDGVMRWREALKAAANISGFSSSAYRFESELIETIVESVSKKVDNGQLFVAKHPVGIESRIHELTIEWSGKRSQKPLIIGLWGMGGIGKTTVAKAVYNTIGRKFRRARSFLANIRENSKHATGLVNLQKQLISDIIKIDFFKIPNIDRGKKIIQERFPTIKVLVVLDDVDSVNQLNTFCGSIEWFCPGSIIFITTRDQHLLDVINADHKYRMREMNGMEPLVLFSWHAFKQAQPSENFIELSKEVVAYCDGLPLALEVLGSCLRGRTIKQWKGVLSKLQRIPNKDVYERLKISYDGLDDHTEKDIFLDICCFFINKDRNYVTQILDGCEFYAEDGLQILIERSLVKVGRNNKLEMHDLLQEMGKEIIRGSPPKHPKERSRLWFHKDVLDVLTKHSGTEAIKGISLKAPETHRERVIDSEAFKEMKKLRLLQLDYVNLKGDYQHLSKELRWLCWHRFPLKCIPKNFYQQNLVAIDFKYSSLKVVWKKPQLLDMLKTLNLSHSSYLTQTPDFTKLPNLERLLMKDCPSLIYIHESIGHPKNLLHVNLKDCKSLRYLPRNIYKLKSVKTLILSGCSLIDHLEEDIEQMESLTTLMADKTAITQVPFSLARLEGLKHGYISFLGHEGRAKDIFPSLIWTWMSPNNIAHSPIEEFVQSISAIDISVRRNSSFCGLSPFLGDLVKLRHMWEECRPQFRFYERMARLLDALYETNFVGLEATQDIPQISYAEASASSEAHDQLQISRPADSLKSLLLQLGVLDKIDLFREEISQGWNYGGWDDFHLPGDQYRDWFIFKGEGRSVIFKVPQVIGYRLKAMLLNVRYSSCTDTTTPQFLMDVLIINLTKATVKHLKGDSSTFHEDAEWQNIISSFQPGDLVELVLSIGPQYPVKKIAAYLIYDGSKPRRFLKSSLSQKLIWVCRIAPVLLICAAIFRKGK
ncbi:TMV resistance protein N-like [Neltuma alba]|uniref:TMV resistance protein N-like n=1 Tax=Neltuma alba TaxID=207710 RepID=UPI0010A2ED18|nr:TMV resistance protein N-like [Prosopis alba]